MAGFYKLPERIKQWRGRYFTSDCRLRAPQVDDRGAPATCLAGRVLEVGNEFGSGEDGADHLPLDADSAAMDNAEGSKSETVGFGQILLNDCLHIAGWYGMQVEDVGDWDADGLVGRFHKIKRPGPANGTGPRLPDYAHLVLSNRLPGMAHDRFHLIFQPEFHLFEPHLFQLFLFGQMGMRFEFIQLMGVL